MGHSKYFFFIDRLAEIEFHKDAQRRTFQALNSMGFDVTKLACPAFMQEANIVEDVLALFG